MRNDDDDEVDFQSDSSFDYYSDSDDEAPPVQQQGQRSSRVIVRPLSNIFVNPPQSNPAFESGANVAAASSAQLVRSPSPAPAVETPEEAEYRIYQQQRRQQMEQHQIIQNNLANRRRELAEGNARPLSVATVEIPLLPVSPRTSQYSPAASPMRGSPVAAVGVISFSPHQPKNKKKTITYHMNDNNKNQINRVMEDS